MPGVGEPPESSTAPPQEASGGDHEHSRELEPVLRPHIWVGSLLDYNCGVLHGEWVDAAQDDDALIADVQHILNTSPTMATTGEPAEDYGIFDYEDFGLYQVPEYDPLNHVARIARGIRAHGPAFAAWAQLHDADPAMLAGFEDAYLGAYESLAAWGQTVLDDLGIRDQIDQLLPAQLARYIHLDAAAWARDAHLSGDIAIVETPGGGVWLFDARQ